MKRKTTVRCFGALLLSAMLSVPGLAQDKQTKGDKPSDADMMAMMMELAKPGENHKLLQSGTGTWLYTVKWWMSPDAPPVESKGTAVTRGVMEGRYVVSEHTGKMQMAGPD